MLTKGVEFKAPGSWHHNCRSRCRVSCSMSPRQIPQSRILLGLSTSLHSHTRTGRGCRHLMLCKHHIGWLMLHANLGTPCRPTTSSFGHEYRPPAASERIRRLGTPESRKILNGQRKPSGRRPFACALGSRQPHGWTRPRFPCLLVPSFFLSFLGGEYPT